MRRLFIFISFLLFLASLSSFSAKYLKELDVLAPLETIKSDIATIKESSTLTAIIHQLVQEANEYLIVLEDTVDNLLLLDKPNQSSHVEKPQLMTPSEQVFSVNNIELGNYKTDVEQIMGSAKRISSNEYGTEWHTYHKDYHLFSMIAYDNNDQVVGLYTNQDLIASTIGIKFGSPKETVRKQLGEPLTEIRKGMVFYRFEANADFDMYLLDDQYITVFYDKHQGNIVTSIQIIDRSLERGKSTFYTESSQHLIEGFEYQLFDLVNATRVNHGLQTLTWDEHIKETARKHSEDMAINQYFNHTNLEGESPFDRMLEDGIVYSVAGENLASGQQSSIFAHEGLMNSLGHRENILHEDFSFLGVGVAFNSEQQPFFTQNFYRK
ncbi:CAP-associated domain-containing protein [Bacillus sp. Marseille-P3661]|uniref:CAP domain-containing protein n=1 Tax=Bacillus sp. Marseille-P3661 TaxID=1936234 RepID=UPI000C82AECF|nr:CAP-associated domain-containing protein [Bacillus sp. Marseille-P3661]